jgi:hypothetical protein
MSPAGITVRPASGVLQLNPAGRDEEPVTVSVASGAPSGYHSVTVQFTDANGRNLPGGTIAISVPAA